MEYYTLTMKRGGELTWFAESGTTLYQMEQVANLARRHGGQVSIGTRSTPPEQSGITPNAMMTTIRQVHADGLCCR